jgi:Lariat debranching enzyme, C-terminal domain
MSHDWPRGIEEYGDTKLLQRKLFFVPNNEVGSPAHLQLLRALQPSFWFAAHHHVKFSAVVQHGSLVPVATSAMETTDQVAQATDAMTQFVAPNGASPLCSTLPDLTDLMTQFLALDKCLPRWQYLSIANIPVSRARWQSTTASTSRNAPRKEIIPAVNAPPLFTPPAAFRIEYDLEWLAILRKTHKHLSKSQRAITNAPKQRPVTDLEIEWVRQRMHAKGLVQTTNTIPAEATTASLGRSFGAMSLAKAELYPIPLSFVPTVPATMALRHQCQILYLTHCPPWEILRQTFSGIIGVAPYLDHSLFYKEIVPA